MGRRVVVTEFDVEFVDLQFQPPIPRQPRFRPLPISPNLVHVAIRLIGLGRRYTPMPEEEERALASQLYTAFLQDLRRRELEPVSPEELLASPAYIEARKQALVRSSPLMVLNPVGNDTGTVMHTRTVAAPGLGVLQGTRRTREATEARILQETRADAALAVPLRVGTFQRKPAIERRSVIRMATREESTTLRASYSVVSELTATDPTYFRPIIGRIEPLDFETFSHELAAMLPRFVASALAVESMEPVDQPAAVAIGRDLTNRL
jgi:hypothetical protein